MNRILFDFLLVNIRRRSAMHLHYSVDPDPAAVFDLLVDFDIPLPISPIVHRLLQAAYDGHPVHGIWRMYMPAVVE